MPLRFIHKGWKLFWKIVFAIFIFVVVVIGGAFIILQLDATEDTIAQNIENAFNKNYKGRLVIGELNGTLPFSVVLRDVLLIADTDSTRPDTVASVERIEAGIDLWALLQNRLVINEFSLTDPAVRLLADGEDSYTFLNALQPEKQKQPDNQSFFGALVKDVAIIAPEVSISSGALFIEEFFRESESINLPEPLAVRSLDANFFLELSDSTRFFDIENFNARIEGYKTRKLTLSGQVYNNNRMLEFNAFHLTLGRSHIHLNGTVEGVNLYAGNLTEQFKNAQYDIEISSHRLDFAAFNKLFTNLPEVEEPLEFSLQVEGEINNLQLQNFQFGIDQSYFSIEGKIEDLFNKNEVNYTFRIDTLEVYKQDIASLLQVDPGVFRVLKNLNLTGAVQGTSDTLSLNIEATSPVGRFSFEGLTQLVEPYNYLGRIEGKGIDLSPFLEGGVDTTFLNFEAVIKGRNTSLTEGRLFFEGFVENSLFAHIPIDSLQLTATLEDGFLDAQYFYTQQNEIIEGEISANFNREQTVLTLSGRAERLDLATLLTDTPVDSTRLNISYFVDLQGLKPDNISGTARFQVEPSFIAGDSVEAHQIEVHLSPETEDIRTLTVNSSLFDLNITGDIDPSNISDLFTYWSNYFDRRITKEILLNPIKGEANPQFTSLEPFKLEGKIDFKNLDIVKNYLSSFPSVTTDGVIEFEVEAGSSMLQFAAQVQSDTLIVSQIHFKDADLTLTGRFRHDKMLKQYSNLELTANAEQLETGLFNMDSLRTHFRFHEDSLFLSQHIKQFSDTSRYRLELYGTLTDTTVTAVIEDFFLGNYRYAWQESQTPAVTYTQSGVLKFDSFRFQNVNSYLALTGALSPAPDDSLRLELEHIDLSRISSLLREQINFSGILNAALITYSLEGKQPAVQGRVNINGLTIKEHLLGDAVLRSNYNREEDRFDVYFAVESDSIEYRNLFADVLGKDLVIEGYYNPDALPAQQDSTFYFEADFNTLDTWILSLILDDIFTEVEGVATGSGYISGNAQDLNFHAELQLHDVFVRPVFVQTEWYLDGEVRLDSEEGVIINYVEIRDESGGTGTLYGQVDLNNFNPIKFIDLKLRLDGLKFLSNSYEPGIPFYGSVAGTGTIHLEGPTNDLLLYSTDDIIVTRYSELGIPLVAETQLAEADEFIEFVESFENPEQALLDRPAGQLSDEEVETGPLEQNIENLTFTDRVNIDLEFRAPQPITVSLIFDPQTGEKLQAEGTGYMTIIMQGGDVQLFGRFNVTGGTYNFVSGQLFSRELEIRPGGFIRWTGEPEEALINIEAVYHARPEIAPLTGADRTEGISRSIPLDLVIEITGTVDNIQQNFVFEIPAYVAGASAIQYRINQINRNEEAKLLQATSILLTGEFLPVRTEGGVSALGERLRQGSTYINPIISNQIVSPFLSKQINALLSSEVSEFDIDFQLNAYGEIDLGVALRLYNDRLILQRQGRLTGSPGQDTFIERLGNLSVAYRITPHLSIRAFHRQVPTLGTFSATQASDIQPSVEGVGLEAQVRFNTWQQLWFNIKELLGLVEDKEGKTDEAEQAVADSKKEK